MDGWVRKVGALLLLAMLLSLQLIATPQATAMTANNSSVTFRRTVVAWYDDNGRLQMNATWVNKTIDFANLTNASCACHNSSSCSASNLTANFNVSVVTLYNMTKKHEQLLFLGISLYNETFNYTMYALVYKAERSQYNFTLITKILADPYTGEYRIFLTGMNIAPNDEDRVVPVGDTIVIRDNLTLSEYYWALNKILMKLRRGDETNWIWGRTAYELRHLSHLIRLKLPEYNQQKAMGLAVSMDISKCSVCKALVWVLCSIGVGYVGCDVACAEVCLPFGLGAPLCFAICYPTCDYVQGVLIGGGCMLGADAVCSRYC
ncbi:hypothetical protein E3E23_09340 [Thermococcus sp. CX2]|uniref:hypothetical protein n=1 Tax=Thermococcus sp. CX2 TaxID=163006 RepID=UPI00143C6B95|nr:hypothetical protein [Thermococcus sp. CX2]NJE86023.1 hypothetical protein [Thermococcus sp. CX2]